MITNTIGLSFSNSALHIIYSNKENGTSDIQSADTVIYPFVYKFEDLLSVEKLKHIGNLIIEFKNDNNLKEANLAVSLPMNFTYTKKIALPLDAADEIATKQVQWELEHYLPGTLSDFKVVKSASTFTFTDYEESLFVCIKKSIIANLDQMANAIGMKLTGLTADSFSLDSFLRSNNLIDENMNQIFLKADELSIISHLFISGKYYISFIDNVYPLKNYSFEEKRLKTAKSQISKIKNLTEHLPFANGPAFELLIYGNSATTELFELVEQNFSDKVSKLTTKSYAKIMETDIPKYVEAIGTCIS